MHNPSRQIKTVFASGKLRVQGDHIVKSECRFTSFHFLTTGPRGERSLNPFGNGSELRFRWTVEVLTNLAGVGVAAAGGAVLATVENDAQVEGVP